MTLLSLSDCAHALLVFKASQRQGSEALGKHSFSGQGLINAVIVHCSVFTRAVFPLPSLPFRMLQIPGKG